MTREALLSAERPEGAERPKAMKEEVLGKFSHLSNIQRLEWN